MSDYAIRVQNLGKRFTLGSGVSYHRFSELLVHLAQTPFRRLKPQVRDPKTAADLWALRDVSFDVPSGQVLGIIGRNGAGKSTLLKIISRITEPTEGEVRVRGRIGSLLEVGTGFHPELTGRENVFLNGAILGMTREEIRKHFDSIIAFAEIERFLDTPVKRYSSGMYMRLAFAVAAHLEPEIMVVDEVLAVGDAAFQKKCLGKMGEVAHGGRTVLFVSHNMAAVQNLCSHAIFLRDGRLKGHGKASDVVTEYLRDGATAEHARVLFRRDLAGRQTSPKTRFQWESMEVRNEAGRPAVLIDFAAPFELLLTGLARDPVDSVRLGFAINSMLGVTIGNSFQIDGGLPARIPSGRLVYRVRIDPNVLAPGSYEIGLGALGEGVTAQTDLVALPRHEWIISAVGIIKPLIHDDNASEVESAIVVNSLLPHWLSQRSERVIQIATDCVYSGSKGSYIESDPHDALDVYGKTKSLGEAYGPRMTHLRCSIVGDASTSLATA